MSLLKKLAGQTAIYGMSSIIGRLLNYLLVPLYTRLFLPAEYGVVTELYAYAGLLMVVFTYGMETAFFRFSSGVSADRQKVLSTSAISLLVSSFVLTGIFIVFDDAFAALLMYPEHSEYITWFGLILGFDALSSIPFAKLRLDDKAVKFAVVKMANILANIGFNLFFLLLCPYILDHSANDALRGMVNAVYDPSVGVGYIFISNLLASGLTLLLLLPVILSIRFSFDTALWKRMIRYSLPLLIVGFAGIINETLDRAMLKYLLPYDNITNLHYLGIYGACYKLSILLTLFVQAYRYAAEPFFFSQAAHENAKALYAKTMKYFVIAAAGIFLLILLYLDVFKYFIDEDYWAGLEVVPILLMANLFLGIYYNMSIWYKLTDQTGLGAIVSVGGAGVTLVLNILLIPLIGYVGSAWATLACYFSMVMASYFLGRKYYHVDYPWQRISAYILGALMLFLAYRWTLMNFDFFSGSYKFLLSTVLLLTFVTAIFMVEKRAIFRS